MSHSWEYHSHTYVSYATMTGKGWKRLPFNCYPGQKIPPTKKTWLDTCMTENRVFVLVWKCEEENCRKKPDAAQMGGYSPCFTSAEGWTHSGAVHGSCVRRLNSTVGPPLQNRLGNAYSFTLLRGATRNCLLSHRGHDDSEEGLWSMWASCMPSVITEDIIMLPRHHLGEACTTSI